MQIQQNNKSFAKSPSKPLCHAQNGETVVVGDDSDQLLLINKHNLTQHTFISTTKTDKTISLKLTDKLLARGGTEGTVALWDLRQLGNGPPIHIFNRPGNKFGSLDISEHILVGGASKKLVFWDLRKMKQRCEFTESFNQDVTTLQFSKEQPTILYAAAYDGLIAKFDLKEIGEQDSFEWGHQILQSPCFLHNSGNITLVQTQNQMILTLEQQSVKDKYQISSIERPLHILSSFLDQQHRVNYYTRNMKNNSVEFWQGKHNIGYIPTSIEVEMLIPIQQNTTIFSDEKGHWYSEQVHKGKEYKKRNENQDFMTIQQWQVKQGKQLKSQINNSGFIISKPSTLKTSHKKFKPY